MINYKILIIEDNLVTIELISKFVKKLGFDVISATDGKTGLELLKQTLPEIIISDLQLPDMNGIELIRKAKEILSDVQVIITTAYAEPNSVIAAIQELAIDYIKKPIDMNVLNVALGRAKEKISFAKHIVPYPTLLLAEDEDVVRNRLSRALQKEGFEVYPAQDGQEAVNMFKEKKIDIVLTDIKMPKKDGLHALHEMRSMNDDFESIILTGYGDEDSAIQALREGAMNFIKKPVNLEELLVSVQKAVEKLQITRALRFRTRELELTKEIVAAITQNKEIVIDFEDYLTEPAFQFARQLLDCFQVGLIVCNEHYKIKYINSYLGRVIQGKVDIIDDELLKNLEKVGIRDTSTAELLPLLKNVMDAPIGTLESVKTGRYSTITLTPITIVDKENKQIKEKAVLLIIRGERA
ncbi:MAG: response regulator [Desulfobacterales bacterium]|nr:response regulator [Desulfobacterales bacterium]